MYCKLFASLYQGTLRGQSDEILVFTNLLANCDRDGYVDKHFRAIADEVGLPVDRVKAAILNLEAPDDESRSKEENGSRIIRIDDHRVWGWQVVNYAKYRAIRNEEDRREQTREAVARHRAKKKAEKNGGVSNVSHGKPRKAHAEVEGEGDVIMKATPSARTQAIAWSSADGWSGISDKDRSDWKEAYPACNITRQLAAAHQWLLANPTKAKKKQWRRFVTGWLTRSQERGGDDRSNKPINPNQVHKGHGENVSNRVSMFNK